MKKAIFSMSMVALIFSCSPNDEVTFGLPLSNPSSICNITETKLDKIYNNLEKSVDYQTYNRL